MMMTNSNKSRFRKLATLFLRLGVVGFGGPLAHVALMEDACVVRRKWLTHEEFLEGLAVCNLLPGPTSTQLSIYLGYVYAGLRGGLISGMCFIFPAFLLVLALAWLYIQFGSLPAVTSLFIGIGPVVIAIIFQTLYRSAKTALTSISSWCIALASCLAVVFPFLPPSVNLLTVLLLSGLAGAILYSRSPASTPPQVTQPGASEDSPETDTPQQTTLKSLLYLPLLTIKTLLLNVPEQAFLLVSLALVFFKIGLLMFGGGLVIAPLLQQELVDNRHWLTTRQLVDGLALGQLTPGPVTVVSTFVGYAVAGLPGGIAATIAVFAPSFLLVLSLAPLLRRLRQQPIARSFLKGITAGALGAIAAAAILLGRVAIVDALTVAIALVSVALLLRWNINSVFLIAGAALLGLLRLAFPLL